MITCAADNCPSTQDTRIDGNLITLFPFPEDDQRKNQWLRNCDLLLSDDEPLYLCELHFEESYFTESKDLKPNAIPTIFDKKEELLIKQEEIMSQTTPPKQKQINELTLRTPPQSPFVQDNIEDLFNENKTNIPMEHVVTVNGSTLSTSITDENSQKNVYRLVIHIDKIRGKPRPKCKKIPPQITVSNDSKSAKMNENGTVKKFPLRPLRIKKICAENCCKLKKCIYNAKLIFQCEVCEKRYFPKEQDAFKNYPCIKCSKVYTNPQALYFHIRKHFICDICLTECSSQITFDKHIKLHVTTDPKRPYKCHQCPRVFDMKNDIKQHYLLEHKIQNTPIQVTSPIIVPKQNNSFCINCNISFTNDQAYRDHMSSHGQNESITCNITSDANNIISIPNPLTGSQIGILQAVKFSCRVCSKEFDNVKEVDLHTRTHLEVPEEGHKCNI
ncbi:zinc finger protein 600 isoform X2 [Cardiocondyla obscurior]